MFLCLLSYALNNNPNEIHYQLKLSYKKLKLDKKIPIRYGSMGILTFKSSARLSELPTNLHLDLEQDVKAS